MTNYPYKYTFRINNKSTSNTCKHSRIKKYKTKLDHKDFYITANPQATHWRFKYNSTPYFAIDRIEQTFQNNVEFK